MELDLERAIASGNTESIWTRTAMVAKTALGRRNLVSRRLSGSMAQGLTPSHMQAQLGHKHKEPDFFWHQKHHMGSNDKDATIPISLDITFIIFLWNSSLCLDYWIK